MGTPSASVSARPGGLGSLGALLLRPVPAQPAALNYATLGAIVAGAGLILASAIIHLHLWLSGYRHITLAHIGVLFLIQSIGGFVLAPLIVASRRLAAVLLGVGYMASTAAGLLISATVGFFGFQDPLSVSWATPSLVIELAGLVVLTGACVPMALRR